MNDPAENWETGILGDSISHGGGRMSYSPADWPYNYAYYLDFPTINISRSGDKTEDLLRRFDADVLPFHVRYLLIMGGTNNLRCGGTAEEVISDLEALQENAGITTSSLSCLPFLQSPRIGFGNITTSRRQKTGKWNLTK